MRRLTIYRDGDAFRVHDSRRDDPVAFTVDSSCTQVDGRTGETLIVGLGRKIAPPMFEPSVEADEIDAELGELDSPPDRKVKRKARREAFGRFLGQVLRGFIKP